MHDPLVVAREIRRPWPAYFRKVKPGQPRWKIKLSHRCRPSCDHPPLKHGGFPWWKPSSYSSHWTLAGVEMWWPSLVTIWHREPDGHDSGTVCPHFIRWRGPDGKWQMKPYNRWKWHVYHWRIQVPMWQELGRRLFQRCAWCSGRSTKRNRVNVSHAWRDKRAAWWRSESHLYHSGCSSAESVIRQCVCDVPLVQGHNGAYGTCTTCGKSYHDEATWIGRRRAVELAGMPVQGQPWRWPREINVQDIAKELEAQRGS
jgi:hypothetical protein